MRRAFWLSLLLGLFFMAGPGHTPQEARAQGGPAGEILRLVNQVRAEHGLSPYTYNATLTVAAQNHANWMANNVIYSHTGAGGSSPQDRANAAGYNGYVSENIVGGMNMTPNQGVIWWRNSAIHYQMMVSNRYSEAGVAFATNGTQNMYVLVMGRPSNVAAAAPEGPEPQSEPLIITPIELAQPREDGSIVHVVQDGQALWQIAAHYEVELPKLLLYNGLDEDDYLQPGDEVIVRLADGAPIPPTPTPPLTHVVREGENAWIIAARFQVDLDTFFYLNGLTEDSVLHPGNEVRIRLGEGEPPPPTPTPKLTHKVKEGDTLWSIAVQNGLEMEELLSLNGLVESAVLQIGQELFVRATPTPEMSPTPEVTPTPEPSLTPTPNAEAMVLATSSDRSPAPEATPTARPTNRPESARSGDGPGPLYIISLLLAGAGILVFVGVVLRRS
ncbi:MAG TPA: LysM peptidoglycan-binding domain-containing protein [Candidatus Sulfomarinibacteraceae bacterium]|nr:LysM peptidoglycan-binding domain-containing protein [Candidatus Sulfomarinibacteraceae bacterium]